MGCWLGIATLIGIAMYLLIPVVRDFIEFRNYYRLQRSTRDLIDAWSEKQPDGVPPEAWEHATDWTKNAFDNIFFSPNHTSLSELEKFRADLETRLAKKGDMDTVDWIWKRLSETGPNGKRYVERFGARYREAFADSPDDDSEETPH